MKAKRKYKFIANVWIVGLCHGRQVLGRTFFRKGKNKIILITDSAETTTVNFDSMERVKIIALPRILPRITSVIENKNRKTVAERLIVEILASINKH